MVEAGTLSRQTVGPGLSGSEFVRVRALLAGQEPRAALAALAETASVGHELEVNTLRGMAMVMLGQVGEAESIFAGERQKGGVTLELEMAHADVLNQLGRGSEAIGNLELAILDHVGSGAITDPSLIQIASRQADLCVALGDANRALQTLARIDLSGGASIEFRRVHLKAAMSMGETNLILQSALALSEHPMATRDDRLMICTRLFESSRFEMILNLAANLKAQNKPLMEVKGFEAAAQLFGALAQHAELDDTAAARFLAAIDTWAAYPRLRAASLFRLAWLRRRSERAEVIADLVMRAVKSGINPNADFTYVLGKLQGEVEERLGLARGGGLEYLWGTDRPAAIEKLTLWARLSAQAGESVQALFALAIALAEAPSHAGLTFAFAQVLASLGQLQGARELFRQTGCIAGNDTPALIWPSAWPEKPFDVSPYSALLADGDAWPKISVVIPTYNQGKYIEETLLSILNQQYPSVEIIVIDAKSTDETSSVLERHKNKIAYMVSEPDNGQSDAINKGFARATGDLVTWLNSDDMLGPGALHMWAHEWLESKADLLFGICMAHRHRVPVLVNNPRVKQEDFTPDILANIGDYWLKGHFFYQPELIFTRSLLDRAGGGVNAENYFCMDYELFINFARVGLKIQAVPWPTALFRHHDQQKTARLDQCVREQGNIRDLYVPDILAPERRGEIRDRLIGFSRIGAPRILAVTTRLNKIFSPKIAGEVKSMFNAQGASVEVTDVADATLWADYDLVILLVHLWPTERVALENLKTLKKRPLLVGWYWDNHHIYMDNLQTSALLDVSIPGHAFAASYLRTRSSVLWPSVPLCVTQWSIGEAEEFFPSLTEPSRRGKSLYGGFVKYPDAIDRNRRLQKLMSSGMLPGIFTIDPHRLDKYFSLPSAERFREWGKHAASLSLPFDQDLSQRFFDAWLTGQVPVVTPDMLDIQTTPALKRRIDEDLVISADPSPDGVFAAGAKAVALFEAGGETGVLHRHELAKTEHMFVHRLQTILDWIRSAGKLQSIQPIKDLTSK